MKCPRRLFRSTRTLRSILKSGSSSYSRRGRGPTKAACLDRMEWIYRLCNVSTPLSTFLKTAPGRSNFGSAAYMPEAHRQFVGIIGELRKVIRGIVDKSDSLILHRRYNDCIRAVRKFRVAHRMRGARYLNAGKYGTSGREVKIVESLVQPIREFEHRMNDRIADTESALLLSDARTEYPSVESTFRFLSPADRALLIETAPCKSFASNEVIMRQGDRRQALYVIKEGFVRIETAARKAEAFCARLWPGEVFGETSFLTNAEATATVIADEKVEVYVLDRTHVYAVIGESPELAKGFYQSLAVQLANRLRDTDALIAALSRV